MHLRNKQTYKMRVTNLKNLQNQKSQRKKNKNYRILITQLDFLEENKKFLNGSESKIFPIEKQVQGKLLELLTPKQMSQRLPIA